jgi:hypothetical protein
MIEEMSALKELIASNLEVTHSYEEYVQLIEALHEQGLTTGHVQNEKLVEYSKLNEHRMKRIYRKQQLDSQLSSKITSLTNQYTWLVITESWCVDGAQNIPILERLASFSNNVCTRYILRDENPTIMSLFLTNGGQSIPIIVCLNNKSEVVFRWGPRPSPLQYRVLEYKQTPEPKISYDEFAKENQLWYAKNKGTRFQEELKILVDLLE